MTLSIRGLFVALSLSTGLGAAAAAEEAAKGADPFARIGHIVVIYTENRSFDHVFGLFPGADGLGSPGAVTVQTDHDGKPLPALPKVLRRKEPDDRFPAGLPNAPFAIEAFAPIGEPTGDLVHDFYQQQEQINGGRMDRFAAVSDGGGLAMGYYDGRKLEQWALAREFTLADRFFHAAFGGSFLNHFFLVCACAPVFPHAPKELVARPDSSTGYLLKASDSPRSALEGPPRWAHYGRVTPDGFVVGALQPQNMLAERDPGLPSQRLPPQTAPTIGDRLSAKGVSWAWYAAGWNDIVARRAEPSKAPEYFQVHHQPFIYFDAYAPGKPARDAHLKDAAEFFAAIEKGALPAVSFYKPVGRDNQHPGYADLATGDEHLFRLVERLRKSPNWADMLIVVTADENGGFFDHVPPPKIDRFGPGARVPTLIISPFARRGYVDHTTYDTTSILRTIEVRFGLAPLTARDAAAADLRNALESGH